MGPELAVDTNVLLRTLVDDGDAPEQCAAARKLLNSAKRVHISSIVFIETLWTLSRRYSVERKALVGIAHELLAHPRLKIEHAGQMRAAVERWDAAGIDLADAVALQHAAEQQVPLYSFDRKLARQSGVRTPD